MKNKTTTQPWKKAEPYIMGAANRANDAYDRNIGNIENVTGQVTGMIPGLIDRFNKGDAGVNAARGYNVDVLSGRYLGEGNPYLGTIADQIGNRTRNETTASLGVRGLTGGSTHADLVSKNVSDRLAQLYYSDYGAERDRMSTAAGQSPGMAAADYLPIDAILGSAGAVTMPLQAANANSSTVASMFAPYTQTTQKQGIGGLLAAAAGSGLAGWASGGFKGF